MDFGALDASVVGGFGEPVLYAPRGGGPAFTLQGIYVREQVLVESGGDGPPASVPRTTLSVRSADLPGGFACGQNDRPKVRGVTYDVRNSLPDGMGWVVLELGRIG